jgi:hypothetical protein
MNPGSEQPETDACLSDLRLDRLLAGELETAARAEAQQHLEGCRRCTARRSEREQERQLFQETAPRLFPPGRLPAATTPAPSRRRPPWLTAGAAAAAAVVLLLIVRPRPDQPAETVTAKGKTHLRYFVRDAVTGQVTPGTPHQRVHPGDQLRFGFDGPPAGCHVALLGRDAGGKATAYFPDRGTAAAPLPASADGLLPYSIVLDRTLGPETIYALYCQQAVALPPLQSALGRSASTIVWPPSCQIEQIQLEKIPRP